MPRHRDEAQAEVARVPGKVRHAYDAIDAFALVLLIDGGGHPIEAEAQIVNQPRRKNSREANQRILASTRHFVAVARDRGQGGPSERLEISSVTKAVTGDKSRVLAQDVIETRVKVIIVISLSWRG